MKKVILLLLSLQCCLYNICLAQNAGDIDNSFNYVGYCDMPNTPWFDIAAQPDGKVLAVSNILARYNINGSLDSTFGINGIDTIIISGSIYYCSAVSIQQDGKILVAGVSELITGSTNLNDFLLIRYNPNGGLDSTFDGDGIVQTDFNLGTDDDGYELAIQSDGKIIVAGSSNTVLALSRYHSNGSLDSTFDYDGRLIITSISVYMNNYWEEPVYMKLQPDGKILAGCKDVLARLNVDGSVDSSFGINGIVGLPHWMSDLAVQPDSKIVLAGTTGPHFAVVRLESNGDLDNNFGNNGVVTPYYWQPGGPDQLATSIVLQPDGKILASGYEVSGVLNDGKEFVLMRFNHDGGLDSSFSADGVVIINFLTQFEGESHASAITPDMKIILAGYSHYSDHGWMAKFHLGWIGWPADANFIPGSNEALIIAPNPASSKLTITSGSKVKELTICNAIGQTTEYTAFSGSGTVTVDVGHLPPGIYYIKFTDETGSARTGKFLKQ